MTTSKLLKSSISFSPVIFIPHLLIVSFSFLFIAHNRDTSVVFTKLDAFLDSFRDSFHDLQLEDSNGLDLDRFFGDCSEILMKLLDLVERVEKYYSFSLSPSFSISLFVGSYYRTLSCIMISITIAIVLCVMHEWLQWIMRIDNVFMVLMLTIASLAEIKKQLLLYQARSRIDWCILLN
jgi:hypothetical protein